MTQILLRLKNDDTSKSLALLNLHAKKYSSTNGKTSVNRPYTIDCLDRVKVGGKQRVIVEWS